MVGLEAHWAPLLEDGLMGCMQSLPNCRGGVVIVVWLTMGRIVVVVIIHGLVVFIVLLLTEKVGVKVSADKEEQPVIHF